jgi:two-component system nitrate/nitrite response regulator NarL
VKLYEEGVMLALRDTPDISVTGSAPDWREGLAQMSGEPPDVALVDLAPHEAVHAVRTIRSAVSQVKLVALAVRQVESEVVAWAESGTAGIVSPDASLSDLVDEIRGVARGEARCSPWLAGLLLRRVGALASERGPTHKGPPLTPREREVVLLLDRGYSNKQIAAHLHLQLPTVKNHVHNILEKLGVGRRGEAASVMRTHGY